MQDEEAIVPQENQALRAWWEEEDRQWILNSRSFSGSCKKLIADYFATLPSNWGCCELWCRLLSLPCCQCIVLQPTDLYPPPTAPIDPTLFPCVPTCAKTRCCRAIVQLPLSVTVWYAVTITHWHSRACHSFHVPFVTPSRLLSQSTTAVEINRYCCSCELPTHLESYTFSFIDLVMWVSTPFPVSPRIQRIQPRKTTEERHIQT